MATDAENLATIQSNLLSALATESANPKPSYNLNGQQVDWNGFRASIMQQLKEIEDRQAGIEGPWDDMVIGML